MGNILEIKRNGVTIEIGADSLNVNYQGNIPNATNVNAALEALLAKINEMPTRIIEAGGSWMSIGTSITRQDADSNNGYQHKVQEHIHFTEHINNGVNGSILSSAINRIGNGADFITIEHGVNDWTNGVPCGTMDNYLNDSGTGTFYGSFRKVLDAIYAAKPSAQIIICTPRKADKYGGYLPTHWYEANRHGFYLKDYANACIEVAKFNSLPVCDWFNESNTNDYNLDANSLSNNGDPALHPNAAGHQKMANLLVQTFKKVLNCG